MATSDARARAALSLAHRRFEDRQGRRPRSLLAVSELSAAELDEIVNLASDIKCRPDDFRSALERRVFALISQKTSTRTRCSFEMAAHELGAYASYIDWSQSNFMLGDIGDEARVLSRYYDMVIARVNTCATLRAMASASEVPVVNGLCDQNHPCQAISDLFTMREYFAGDVTGLRLTFIGDGNNVCRSLVEMSALAGMQVTLCSPPGFELGADALSPDTEIVERTEDPFEAVANADVIYTDTWISMGQESDASRRLTAFRGFQVDERLMAAAPSHALFMHCLSAHVNREVSAQVLRSPRSIVFDQAENRKHAQKGLLLWLHRLAAAHR